MKKLRSEYHYKTGQYPCKSQPNSLHNSWKGPFDEEYTQWLENTIEDTTKLANDLLYHPIFYTK